MEFPKKHLGELRKLNKLDEALNALANICLDYIQQQRASELDKFVQGYIHAEFSTQLPRNGKLRKAVYSLVFEHKILKNSAVEFQWEVICVYGPTNYGTTVGYLNSLPEFFTPKFKRLLVVCEPNEKGAAILFNSKFVSILHDAAPEWWADLKKHDLGVYLVANRYNYNESVQQLRTLFPQLSVDRATRLLRDTGIEGATQKLLDDEDAGKRQPRKVFEPLQKKKHDPQLAKTLELAYSILNEDDPEELDEPVLVRQSPLEESLMEYIGQIYDAIWHLKSLNDPNSSTWTHLLSVWAQIPEHEKQRMAQGFDAAGWTNLGNDAELTQASASAYLYEYLINDAGKHYIKQPEPEPTPPKKVVHQGKKERRGGSSAGRRKGGGRGR